MSVPDWVIKQKKENTEFVNNYIDVAMNGSLELKGNTTLQKLSRLKMEIKDLPIKARKSFIDKNKWSMFVSFYRDLATTEVKKTNLEQLTKYIELYKLSI